MAYVNSSYLVENVLKELCDSPAGVFAEPGNYFQPNITLIATIVFACLAVTFKRLLKILNIIYQRYRGFEDVNVPKLISKIIVASQQPRAIQRELLEQLDVIAPEFKLDLCSKNTTNFIDIVERHINQIHVGYFGERSDLDSSDGELSYPMNMQKSIVNMEESPSEYNCRHSQNENGEEEKEEKKENEVEEETKLSELPTEAMIDKKSLKSDPITVGDNSTNRESQKTSFVPRLTTIVNSHFEKDKYTMQKVLELFEVTTDSLEKPRDRELALLFLLCNTALAIYVMVDFYSQQGPKGDMIYCQIPYVLSIVCFKPFTLPMWACIAVTTQFSFTELMFGDHPRGRDVTGTTVCSPLPRNMISFLLLMVISVLFFLWMLCALVFYAYPLAAFSPILILPSVIVPVISIVIPMLFLDAVYRGVRSFLLDERRAVNIKHKKRNSYHFEDEDEEDDDSELGGYDHGDVGEEDYATPSPTTGIGVTDAGAKYGVAATTTTTFGISSSQKVVSTIQDVIAPKIDETSRLLKIGSFQMILIISVSFTLIQFYHYESFTYVDGVDALHANLDYGFDHFVYIIKMNFFEWPHFNNHKRYEVCFILGIAILFSEYFILFGLKFLRWFQSVPLCLLTKPKIVCHQPNLNSRLNRVVMFMEVSMSRCFGFVLWMPFRTLLNLVRTGLELSYQQWQIEIVNSMKEESVEDPTGAIHQQLVHKYPSGLRIIYSIYWWFGTVTFVIPLYYSYLKPRIKVFGEKVSEEEIREFCNDEIALCYQGIEIDSLSFKIKHDHHYFDINGRDKTKSFVDMLGCCVWFNKLNLINARKVKVNIERLSVDFIHFQYFSLFSIQDKFESLALFKNVKSVKMQHGDEKLDYAYSLKKICEKHAHCRFQVMFHSCQTLMHRAALNGDDETLRLLVEHKSDIEAKDETGSTPLLLAAFAGKHTCVDVLLEYFAEIETMDKIERTPLMLAAWEGHEKCVDLLLVNNADTEVTLDDLSTPLHKACELGFEGCVRLLLQHAAETETDNEEGRTPLHEAVHANQPNCVKLLLEAHADTEALTNHGRTALLIAATSGFDKCVELLLENGADSEALNTEGCTPLIKAAGSGHASVLELLLDHGADIDAIDEEGLTALMSAAEKGHGECVSVLLRHGANTRMVDLISRTAAVIAHEARHEDIVELIRKGPQPKMTSTTMEAENTIDADPSSISTKKLEEKAKNGKGSSSMNNVKDIARSMADSSTEAATSKLSNKRIGGGPLNTKSVTTPSRKRVGDKNPIKSPTRSGRGGNSGRGPRMERRSSERAKLNATRNAIKIELERQKSDSKLSLSGTRSSAHGSLKGSVSQRDLFKVSEGDADV